MASSSSLIRMIARCFTISNGRCNGKLRDGLQRGEVSDGGLVEGALRRPAVVQLYGGWSCLRKYSALGWSINDRKNHSSKAWSLAITDCKRQHGDSEISIPATSGNLSLTNWSLSVTDSHFYPHSQPGVHCSGSADLILYLKSNHKFTWICQGLWSLSRRLLHKIRLWTYCE